MQLRWPKYGWSNPNVFTVYNTSSTLFPFSFISHLSWPLSRPSPLPPSLPVSPCNVNSIISFLPPPFSSSLHRPSSLPFPSLPPFLPPSLFLLAVIDVIFSLLPISLSISHPPFFPSSSLLPPPPSHLPSLSLPLIPSSSPSLARMIAVTRCI